MSALIPKKHSLQFSLLLFLVFCLSVIMIATLSSQGVKSEENTPIPSASASATPTSNLGNKK